LTENCIASAEPAKRRLTEEALCRPSVLAIGTATPAYRVTQEETVSLSGYVQPSVRRIFRNSGIDFRHFYFEGAARPQVFGARLFDHLDRSPDAGATFHEAMIDLAALISQAVLLAYDFAGIHLLVDVGGGYGKFLTDILTVYPNMRGILVDTPAVSCQAKGHVEGHLSQPRCTLVAGSLGQLAGDSSRSQDSQLMCFTPLRAESPES
jgi:hypothetical protein